MPAGDDVFWIGSDNLVVIPRLINAASGAAITSGLVTAQLKTQAGASVGAEFSLAHDGSVSGRWSGVLPYSLSLTEGDTYHLDVTAVAGGYRRVWRLTRRAAYGR